MAMNEPALRRLAARRRLKLTKSRSRNPDGLTFGGFMIVDAETNSIVAGGSPVPYFLSLEDVEAWLAD